MAAASLLYFALTAITAHCRPLWYDELFTFHVARQKRVADVLRALAAGADIHPPLDCVLRHYRMRLLGTGELPDRLPSILAFWLMCLALRRPVAHRCGAVLGMAAFLAPLNTLAYDYAYEGRGYLLPQLIEDRPRSSTRGSRVRTWFSRCTCLPRDLPVPGNPSGMVRTDRWGVCR